MSTEYQKAMKHIADARRELGALAKSLTLASGQRIVMDRALTRLKHAEKRLCEATVREDDTCEHCEKPFPPDMTCMDDEGVSLCLPCAAALDDAHAESRDRSEGAK